MRDASSLVNIPQNIQKKDIRSHARFVRHLLAIALIALTGCSRPPASQSFAQRETAREERASSQPKSPSYVPPGYMSAWTDQFSTAGISTDNWIVGTLRAPNGDIVPGAVGDHLLNAAYSGYVTDEDSFIDQGALVLRNQKRAYAGTSPAGRYDYTSGWVMSMHKVSFNKGYLEIRAKFPSGDKVWPAIWLIAEDLRWGPEWDIFEYFGYRKDVGYDNMGTHLATGEWPTINWKSHWLKQYDAVHDCEAWHTYGFEWTATEATWSIDGKNVHTLRASDVPDGEWPDEDMYIVLNNGVRRESPDNTTKWPNYLLIDYIELYQKQR